jgi:hypothetical protein
MAGFNVDPVDYAALIRPTGKWLAEVAGTTLFRRYRLADYRARANFGSNGIPDLRTP